MRNFNTLAFIICILLAILFFNLPSKADVLLSVTAKYGANGFDAQGSTSTSTLSTPAKKHKTTSFTTTTGSLDVDNRVQLVPGITLQTIPEKKYDLSIGGGIYTDSTVSVFLGIRL